MRLPDTLKLYFDGGCTPPQAGGVATYGWRICTEDGVRLYDGSGRLPAGPASTNNTAEWAGLLNGLKALYGHSEWSGKVHIYGDSMLVICQLNGEWKVKKPHLRPYHEECRRLLDGKLWEAMWIPRDQNKECDRLTRDGR